MSSSFLHFPIHQVSSKNTLVVNSVFQNSISCSLTCNSHTNLIDKHLASNALTSNLLSHAYICNFYTFSEKMKLEKNIVAKKYSNFYIKRNVFRFSSKFTMSTAVDELSLIKNGELSLSESLKSVDGYLQNNEDSKALEAIRLLQKRPDGLKGFGNASQIPQRAYGVEDLRLNKIDTKQFLAPEDNIIQTIKRTFQIFSAVASILAWKEFNLDQIQILIVVVSFLFLGTLDQIVNAGGIEFLILDTAANTLSKQYKERVIQHEAGHFLTAYLLGFFPKLYTLSTMDAFLRFGTLKVQAGTTFIDLEYQNEVSTGKISSTTINKITCIGLAGVVIEYLKFGKAQGGLSDIQQLDSLFRSLGFSQKKTDGQIRYAVLNTVLLLRRHQTAHAALVQAMASGSSIGECVQVIENELAKMSDI